MTRIGMDAKDPDIANLWFGFDKHMDIELILLRAIKLSSGFPKVALRDRERLTGCEATSIMERHIEQRRLLLAKKPPNDQARRLEAFIANLSPHIDKELVGGCLWTSTHRYWVWVDPKEEKLLHWDEYPRDSRTIT